MSDSDRIATSYGFESVFGGALSSTALKRIRMTSESLRQETQSVTSAEITGDRQDGAALRTSINGAGGIGFELSYGAHDDFIAAAMMAADWSTPQTEAGTDISFVAPSGGTQTINKVVDTLDAFDANQWVKISGATNPENNGFRKVVTIVSSSQIVVRVATGEGVLEAAGASITIVQGAQVVNGTSLRPLKIERHFQDLTNKYAIHEGNLTDVMELRVRIGQVLTGSFDFLGKSEVSASSSMGSSYIAAPTKTPITATGNLLTVLEAGEDYCITELTLRIQNNLRQRLCVGKLGPESIKAGSVSVSGSLEAYFTDETLVNKYLNWTTSNVALVVQDGELNAYIVEIPALKFTAGPRNATGKNTDVLARMTFQGHKHETEGVSARITRFPAA